MSFSALFLLIVALVAAGGLAEQHELRVYEGAPAGTRLTMSAELKRRVDALKSCFGQLETELDWLEFRSSRAAFHTTVDLSALDVKQQPPLEGTLHLLCAGNKMHSLPFTVHITRRNRHPPMFSLQDFHYFVPVSTAVNTVIGRVEVSDHDAVIYNSQRELSFIGNTKVARVEPDGNVLLNEDLSSYPVYRPIRLQLLAIDFGSPQLFSKANLTITPVTVSQVRSLRVNVATSEYQIFEWERPEFGHADKFRLTIRKKDSVLFEEEFDGSEDVALTRVPVQIGADFSYSITSIDQNGETPSDNFRFSILHNDLECSGECASGGVPLCFYGRYNKVEQFVDSRGAHCQCFPGHSGFLCDHIDVCQGQKTSENWGGLDWNDAAVNATVSLPCPYNSDGLTVSRRCGWDAIHQRATWEDPTNSDKCKLQSSVLTHLGMLGTFAQKAESVSTMSTVARFLQSLLLIPAFSNDSSSAAHFDSRIAEHVVQVMATVASVDLDSLSGNATLVKDQLESTLEEFSRRLPVPYSLQSPSDALHVRTVDWIASAANFETSLGHFCFIHLPAAVSSGAIRSFCARNASFLEGVHPSSPALGVFLDGAPPSPSLVRLPHKMRFGLRPSNTSVNYTCVFYDHELRDWSIRGIHRISANTNGFVVCESSHLSLFSLLPEWMFEPRADFLRDFGVLLPTVTTFIALICTTFLTCASCCQRGQKLDLVWMLFLFCVFSLHLTHLVLLSAPQVPSSLLHPLLQLGLSSPSSHPSIYLSSQFLFISLSVLLSLLITSIHSLLLTLSSHGEKPHPTLCSRSLTTFVLAILLPAGLTFTTWYFSPGTDYSIAQVLARVDWLFIVNSLLPVVVFLAISLAYAVWNIYVALVLRARLPQSSQSLVSACLQASVAFLLLLFSLVALVLLFYFRQSSLMHTVAFSMAQISFSCLAFLTAGYLFKMKYLEDPYDESSTRSLERKRDISRALLEHVDVDAPAGSRPLSSSSGVPPANGVYLPLTEGDSYQRAPMVSIV